MVWKNEIVPEPDIPPPYEYGWIRDEEDRQWKPCTTTLPPAPEGIIQLDNVVVRRVDVLSVVLAVKTVWRAQNYVCAVLTATTAQTHL